ncbi:MAG: hypothetical protein AAF500_09285 [Myxococcota bacterium]
MGEPLRRRRWPRLVLAAALVLAIVGAIDRFLPADIRPDGMRSVRGDDAEARERLEEVRAAHGASAWENYGVMEVAFDDDWPFWLTRTALSPWDVPEQQLRAKLLRRSWTTEMTLLNGDQPGKRWGVQSWKTWTAPPSGVASFEPSWVIRTMVPGLRYFLELPLAQDTATLVQDAGEVTVGDETYERLYVTWRRASPQRDLDQYVLWIEPDSGLVERVDFTIRALSGLAVARADFRDYRDFGGVKVPSEIVIDGVLPTGHTLPVHIIRVHEVVWDSATPDSLKPDPSLVDLGEVKPR